MQNQSLPLILSFGPADPVGAVGPAADAVVAASFGCHCLPVTTGLLIADTARIDELRATDTDWLVDQARVLLEDMPVAAFKVGPVCSAEQLQAIAEIVADYPQVPLVLDPFLSALPEGGVAGEDMLEVLRQTLVPLATVFVLSHHELARMAELWRDPGEDLMASDAGDLIHSGCEFVLVNCTDAHGQGDKKSMSNTLFDVDGEIETFNWQHLPHSYLGAGSTMSAAIAALMAHGLEAPDACATAQEYTAGALVHAQRYGMGKYLPNRLYRLFTQETS